MKREMLTGVIAFLLLLAISCSKENTNSPSSSSQSSIAAKPTADELATDRNVAGEWILYYDWYCDGSYGATTMTVNADGTWTNGEGNTGRWSKGVGIFVFNFDGYETIYAGDVYPNSIKGLNTIFSYGDGCFRMEPAVAKDFKGQRDPDQPNASGKQ